MSFLVTARKYRPTTFREIVAQDHVVHTLKNSIRLGRIAHAYLFCGPRGVGKTTTARIFAKALNCPHANEGEPCNACHTCLEITEGRSMDVLEIDGASNNGVEQVRTLRDSVRFMPVRDRFKIYVIDEVHMLTKEAFNALLKTLEEPPPHALFIFATTEPHKLIPTVLSRCQRHDFKRIRTDDIVRQLKDICEREGIEADEEALYTIAKKGDGSMRDAESIFDQVVAYAGDKLNQSVVTEVLHLVDEELFFRVTDLISASDSAGGFALVEEIVSRGHDIQDFLVGLEEHLRNLLVVRTTGESRLVEASEETRRRYAAESARFPEEDLLRLLRILADTIQAIRFSPQPRIKFEIALVAMIRMDSTVLISELLAQAGGEDKTIIHKRNPGAGSAGARSSAPAVAATKLSVPDTLSSAGFGLPDEKRYTKALQKSSQSDPTRHFAGGASAAPEQDRQSSPQLTGPVHPLVRTLIDRLGAVILPDS